MTEVPTTEAVRRSRVWVGAVVGALVLAGAVLQLTHDGKVSVLGGFLLGVAVIFASGRVFYEIGIGEDRERAARGRLDAPDDGE